MGGGGLVTTVADLVWYGVVVIWWLTMTGLVR